MMTSSFIDIADPEEIAKHINKTQLGYFKEHMEPLIETHLLGEVLFKESYPEAPDPDMDQETFINGGFINLFNDSFYNEERELILKLADDSEHIKFGFAYYALLNDESRFLFAQSSVDQQRKIAWEFARYEYPFGKLDDQLSISRNKIATSVFPNTASQAHPYPYSNIADTITGILENNDTIAEDEKNIISNIATFLIKSGAPQEAANCGIQSPEDLRADQDDECHDLAYIETAIEALYIEQNEADKSEHTFKETSVSIDLQPFWHKASQDLRTQEARAYFNVLKELHDQKTPLVLPDNLMDHVQLLVLERGTGGMHPHNHNIL